MTDTVQQAIDEAYAASIQGWDFSWLDGRAREVPPPWDYGRLVVEAAKHAERMFDIDTGGGEFLAGLEPLPGFVVATEGFGPNVGPAAATLAPAGITVVHTASAPDNVEQPSSDPASSVSPFADGAFDLVIDRHSSYWPSEVRRVLRPGGRFLTQQRAEAGASGDAWADLFDRPSLLGTFDVGFAVGQLREAGFDIVRAEEAETPVVFNDLAAAVYYLRLVEWAVEGFDPDHDREALTRIAERIAVDGELRIRGSCMLIDALTPTT